VIRSGLSLATALNVALLGNLVAVCYALAQWAASVVWWSGALLIAAPLLAVVTAVVAARRGRRRLAVLNGVCAVPYAVLLVLCLRGVPSGGQVHLRATFEDAGVDDGSP